MSFLFTACLEEKLGGAQDAKGSGTVHFGNRLLQDLTKVFGIYRELIPRNADGGKTCLAGNGYADEPEAWSVVRHFG